MNGRRVSAEIDRTRYPEDDCGRRRTTPEVAKGERDVSEGIDGRGVQHELLFRPVEFEWDAATSSDNLAKHGVDFAEAMTVFGDPFEITIVDPDHSEDEFRFLSVGLSAVGRLLVVSYTERAGIRTRIISAREAAPQERRQYESKPSR